MGHLLKSLVISFAVIAFASSSFADNKHGDNIRDRDKKEQRHGMPSGKPFKKLMLKLEALEDRVEYLEKENAELKSNLACVSGDSDAYDVYFEGCNVHVRNGVGQTESINGMGNLIVGYNEIGEDLRDRTGSHNLIIGIEHAYNSYGGFVAGALNTVSAPFTSVSGGRGGEASGEFASISGGEFGQASGIVSSVSGGVQNEARGPGSSVSGGELNVADGIFASVNGGESNRAEGPYSIIVGGSANTASGNRSSVLGGSANRTSGSFTTVSGGGNNEAYGEVSSVSGGRDNQAVGMRSNISGGHGCEIVTDRGWGVGDTDRSTTGCVKTNYP